MISVSLSIADARASADLRDAVAAIAGCRLVESADLADVVIADRPLDAHSPQVIVDATRPEPMSQAELSAAIQTAIEHGTSRASGGALVACWSPKGGVGTTTFAVNLAAAVFAQGHSVAYADLDPIWGDGATFFGSLAVDETAPTAVNGVRPLVHACGLKGFVARSDADVEALARGLRAGFALSVLDVPAACDPGDIDADVVLLVVGADLMALRRARLAIDRSLGKLPDLRPVACVRRGAELTVDDLDAVLRIPAVAVLVDEPAVVGWGDRGAFMFGHRRSRWSREVRALARSLGDEFVQPASTTGLRPAGDEPDVDPLGRLAERLRA